MRPLRVNLWPGVGCQEGRFTQLVWGWWHAQVTQSLLHSFYAWGCCGIIQSWLVLSLCVPYSWWLCPCVSHAHAGSVPGVPCPRWLCPWCAMPTPALFLMCPAHVGSVPGVPCPHHPAVLPLLSTCLSAVFEFNVQCLLPRNSLAAQSYSALPCLDYSGISGNPCSWTVISKPKSWGGLGSFHCTLFIFPFPPTPHTTWGNNTGCSQMVTYKSHCE